MGQNRNKLINFFIANLSNAIVHRILEEAIDNADIADRYGKELTTSFEIAKRYREKINPIHTQLPDKDLSYIKTKIANRVRSELLIRISKGYENIDLDLIETFVDESLKAMHVI